MNNEKMEVKESHKYLGTMISKKGRKEEMEKRVTESKGVANEIVEICKRTELSVICMKYVQMLTNACFDMKIKYGCEFWDTLNKKQTEDINKIKINMMKRILEVPYSTPSVAVQHDCGVIDMALQVKAEKLIFVAETLKKGSSVERNLLQRMLEKKVPGFCEEVTKMAGEFNIELNDLKMMKDIRKVIKQKVHEIQSKELFKNMMTSTKTNGILLNFNFKAKPLDYLTDLNFKEARVIFMLRARMLPTGGNFPGRWESETCCVCGLRETDEHLFTCPGYIDITEESMNYGMFFKLNCTTYELSEAAKRLIKIEERLTLVKKI